MKWEAHSANHHVLESHCHKWEPHFVIIAPAKGDNSVGFECGYGIARKLALDQDNCMGSFVIFPGSRRGCVVARIINALHALCGRLPLTWFCVRRPRL